MNLYGFTVVGPSGEPFELWDLHGRVVLIATLPTAAEPSPRAEGLDRLATMFGDQGLTVLGLPEATGSGSGYGVGFPVLGPESPDGPLLSWLVSESPTAGGVGLVPTFTRFLVGRDGAVVARFPADGDPKQLIGAVQEQLAAPVPPTPPRPAPAAAEPVAADPVEPANPTAGLPAVLDPAPVGGDGGAIIDAELVDDDEDRLAQLEREVATQRVAVDLAEDLATPETSVGRDLQDLSDDLRELEIDSQLRGEQP
ncbi:MAG: hypothetical protein U0R64_00355 [Candidatus Nanopelagicales bacterium]